ncbi:PDZ domain-containing protein [Guptibacillus algicola]|uniref:PDZ domain-containing protein n=1 Tax=Guptibacillus algicola TaxID=225844 RepID=UPI001CD2DA58|nr:PDZ domain-containing protein [Alkalihalobacillus algicola]MCA0986836.1 PDZ domain-containing protein [Alkalihalobacillus algicola]
MAETIGLSILKGIVSFLINPLTYISLVAAFMIGLSRVKRDRRDFHTRVHDVLDDVKFAIVPGIIAGISILILNLLLGLVVPMGIVLAISISAILILVTGQMRFLSPAFVFILPVLAALYYEPIDLGSEWLNSWQTGFDSVSLIALALIAGLLLIVEGVLIHQNARKQTSPRLVRSKRGKLVGAHEVQRLWLLPLFLFLPSGAIEASSWWPLLEFGDQTYSFLILPLPIGFRKLIHHTLPAPEIKRNGIHVVTVGVFATLLATVSYFVNAEWLALSVFPLIVILRAAILLLHRGMNKPAYFNERNEGLVILGILPESPADQMNLQVGEVISKVNGLSLGNGTDFYTALQQNAAFCKLQVLDFNGEIRFEQRALYNDQHHELGLLFVKEQRLDDSIDYAKES